MRRKLFAAALVVLLLVTGCATVPTKGTIRNGSREGLAPEFVELSAAHVRAAVAGDETHGAAQWLDLKARVVAAGRQSPPRARGATPRPAPARRLRR